MISMATARRNDPIKKWLICPQRLRPSFFFSYLIIWTVQTFLTTQDTTHFYSFSLKKPHSEAQLGTLTWFYLFKYICGECRQNTGSPLSHAFGHALYRVHTRAGTHYSKDSCDLCIYQPTKSLFYTSSTSNRTPRGLSTARCWSKKLLSEHVQWKIHPSSTWPSA